MYDFLIQEQYKNIKNLTFCIHYKMRNCVRNIYLKKKNFSILEAFHFEKINFNQKKKNLQWLHQ